MNKKLLLTLFAAMAISMSFTMAADETDDFLNSLIWEEATTGSDTTTLSDEDIPAELQTQDSTGTQTNWTSTQTQWTSTQEDTHSAAIVEPKADLVKKSDGNYLDVKWDVDSSYSPMVFITKDGNQIFGDSADKANIKLDQPGTYSLSFQVKQGGEYVEAFTKTIENKVLDTKAMTKVKVGPAENMMIAVLALLWLMYIGYRARAYSSTK